MWREIDAAAELLPGSTLSVCMLLDDANRIVELNCGDPDVIQRETAEHAREIFGIRVERPVDVVIAGSYPRQHDLRQGFKCIPNALRAVRPGGIIIAVMNLDTIPILPFKVPQLMSKSAFRRMLRWLGPSRMVNVFARISPSLNDESRFFAFLAMNLFSRNEILACCPKAVENGFRFPYLDFHADIESSIRQAADDLEGSSPVKVAVFPQGGICFPVVPDLQSAGIL
jgi:hypothetical protein